MTPLLRDFHFLGTYGPMLGIAKRHEILGIIEHYYYYSIILKAGTFNILIKLGIF